MEPTAFFGAIAHETRLRCMLLLQASDELCVCELTHAIGASQPHVSRHLGQLRELGLVIDRRTGLWIHYRINPGLPAWIFEVLDAAAAGVGRDAPFARDVAALDSMPNRPDAPRCA